MNRLTTAERRKRVRELWGRPDRMVAEILIEDGFRVCDAPMPRGADARRTYLESMRRRVSDDREWWREHWRTRAETPTRKDFTVARQEHIASLESDLEDIQAMIDDHATKATAKAMLIGERRQTRALLAKTRGVEELIADPDSESGAPPKVIGVVLGMENVSKETRDLLRAQGVPIPQDDDGD